MSNKPTSQTHIRRNGPPLQIRCLSGDCGLSLARVRVNSLSSATYLLWAAAVFPDGAPAHLPTRSLPVPIRSHFGSSGRQIPPNNVRRRNIGLGLNVTLSLVRRLDHHVRRSFPSAAEQVLQLASGDGLCGFIRGRPLELACLGQRAGTLAGCSIAYDA